MFLAPKDELETKNPMDEVFPTDHRWLFSEMDQPVKVSMGESFGTATPKTRGSFGPATTKSNEAGALTWLPTKTGVWATGALDPDGPQAAISTQIHKNNHWTTDFFLIVNNLRVSMCDGKLKNRPSIIISGLRAKTPPSL